MVSLFCLLGHALNGVVILALLSLLPIYNIYSHVLVLPLDIDTYVHALLDHVYLDNLETV